MLARFDWNRILGFMKLFGHYDCAGHGAGPDKKGRQKPTISVAGYLATAGQWYQHDLQWRRRLKVDGFTEFHMTDFMANSKAFQKCKKWSLEQRLKFLNDLISIIINNVTFAIGMSVRRADYNRVLDEMPDEVHDALGGPYPFCVYRCFESGTDWSKEHRSRDAINYILESGDPDAQQVDETHRFLSRLRPLARYLRVGSLTFEPKVNTSLQAADLLAWALNWHHFQEDYKEPEYEDMRPALTRLLGSVDNMYKAYYEDDLRGYLADMIKRAKLKGKKGSPPFFIINVPEKIANEVAEKLEKQREAKDGVRKVRRNNARTVSRSAKRATKGTGKRRASKSAKKKAAS